MCPKFNHYVSLLSLHEINSWKIEDTMLAKGVRLALSSAIYFFLKFK
jgi:hypothetical protein